MNLGEIKEAIKENREKEILTVLNGEKQIAQLLYTRPNDVIEFVESMGGEDMHDLDTNGYQWDYWAHVKYKGEKYMISGDGYYNDSCSFRLMTKNEE
jgi:hypothetical protein